MEIRGFFLQSQAMPFFQVSEDFRRISFLAGLLTHQFFLECKIKTNLVCPRESSTSQSSSDRRIGSEQTSRIGIQLYWLVYSRKVDAMVDRIDTRCPRRPQLEIFHAMTSSQYFRWWNGELASLVLSWVPCIHSGWANLVPRISPRGKERRETLGTRLMVGNASSKAVIHGGKGER